ncbi:MAG: ATP-binding protein [Isosphaeraceae bacterium]
MSHAKQVGQGRQRGRCLSRLRPMKALPDETRTQRTIRDLVALSTLPSIWVNYQPLQVAQSLAEVLQSTLGLDLVYLRLRGQADGGAIEVARTGRRPTEAGQAEEIGRALTPWLDRAHTNSVVSVPNPVGSGTVRIVRIPIGWEGEEWVLVAGSQHADFPTDEERSLLSVGANQAAMMLQRKQAEETLRASEGRFCGTFENAAGGIANTDRQGGFLRVNDKLCDIVGYTREELLERSFVEITHPDFLPANLELYARLWRSEIPSFTAEKRYIRKDGSLVWCEVMVSLQCDATGAPAYAIAVIKDVSDRKRLEAELRLAKEAAEAANRAKDEFLANVSHEIRTPFGAILGMTELVLETPLNEDQRECLEIAKSAADSLLGIINDLLDFEKIEAGKLELDPSDFSLREVLLDTLQTMVVRAQAKGIELVCDIHPDAPDALVGDAGRLRQVLINLISNAIKFTIHGQVAVRVKVDDGPAPQGVALLCFMVSDTGIGIPPEGRERIFRAFEQAESTTTRRYGGTGLGLTIAARLVSLMGGTINVESEPGRGSTFFFTARFGQQPHPRERVVARPSDVIHEAAMPTRLAAPLRILAAEDSQLNSQHLERLLTRRGHTMRVATDGREALDLAIEGAFDLLLLDLHMPELDGFQVVRAIRLREHTMGGRLPVIALTARARKEDRESCLAAGMDDYLSKPVRAVELFAAIDRVVAPDRVSLPGVASLGDGASLIDPAALLTACDGDGEGLRAMCRDFQVYAPAWLAEASDALQARDAQSLREAAHKLCGLLLAFSTAAGGVASDLEDQAAHGRLDEARPLVVRLESMVQELIPEVDNVSCEALRDRAGAADDPSRTTGA